MGLTPGTRIGTYDITAAIGAGGMGEVYRAKDTRLGRDVALKILPDSFTNDSERIARFRREAQLLASLNHPHIAQIHGFDEANGSQFLILEFVDGASLDMRIRQGPIALQEALGIARQIAQALEAAHEKGIVHRDLKPANIALTRQGVVKVLDFGLAKATDTTGTASLEVINSPTITSPVDMTAVGVILGTAAYMAPEQVQGRAADKRSDVWAFGVVLYEMLTGERPFKGNGVPEMLSSVLMRQPDWTVLPARVPALIRRLLRRCLEKDRTRRLADIADARLDIEDALAGSDDSDAPLVSPVVRARERVAWASSLLLVAVLAAVVWATRPVSIPPETTRAILSVAPTGGTSDANPLEQRPGAARPTRTAIALSPDGRMLVFGGIWGRDQQLYMRAMDQLTATPLAGTTGGYSPFFSPDGQWVGFAADGELRKVPLSGGPAVTLCKASALFGATWGDDGTIVFAEQRNGGLWRVPAAGGTRESLTTPQPGEYSHRLPHMLPGSQAVIFTILKGPTLWDDTQIVVRSLATGQQTVLVTGGADGRYVPTGHLVYVRLGTLMAIPFDPVRLAVTGGATGVVDDVMQAADRDASYMANTLSGQFTMSDTGTLLYLTGGAVSARDRSLAWVDRHGTSQAISAPPRPYGFPRLSPDGQRVAINTLAPVQVWSVDIARGALSPVTVDNENDYGVFAPDGKRIVFRSRVAGSEGTLSWKAADGSGAAERLTTRGRSQTPSSWSPDGNVLAFMEEGESTGFFQFDIWVLSIADRKATALIHSAANEMTPEFSPDGRWLAYVSNVSGRNEVYVQPYPGPGERHLVSTSGGEQPAWSRDGRELFYVQGGLGSGGGPMKLVAVRVPAGPQFRPGAPETIFEHAALASAWGRAYDVAPDGRRFLLVLPTEARVNPAPAQMILVQHWFEELKHRVPTK